MNEENAETDGGKIQSITSCQREPSSSSEPRRRSQPRSPPSLDDDLRDGPRVFVGWMVRQARPPRHTPARPLSFLLPVASSPSLAQPSSTTTSSPSSTSRRHRTRARADAGGRTGPGLDPGPARAPRRPRWIRQTRTRPRPRPSLVEVIGEFAIGEVVVADLIVPPAAAPTTPSTAAAAAEPGRPSSGFV